MSCEYVNGWPVGGGGWGEGGDGAQRSMVDIEIWRWNAGNVWKRFTTEIVLTF